MKVILLAPTPPPFGGIAGWTERMLKAELKNGWEMDVVDEKVISGRDAFGDSSRRNILTEVKRCWKIWTNLHKKLKDKDVKVVHSCIPSLTTSMLREYVCAIITKLHRRKFIIHFRCTVPNTTKGCLGHFILKRLCNISDLILSLNAQSSSFLRNLIKTPIQLIPNFVAQTEIETEHTINETVKNIIYVGGVIGEKGAYELIDTAKEFPEISFRLIGKTDTEIIEYVKEQKVNNVIFAGTKSRQEVKKELMDADVFMFLTYYRGEGFSNALAEAMAVGLPCIATDWAANKDMLADGGGFIVPIKDAKRAVAAVKAILPKEVREKQSCFNINKIKNAYADTVVIGQYVDAYESVLKEN